METTEGIKEVEQVERSDEFYEEFGRQVLKLFEWSSTKVPFMMKKMAKTDAGLRIIGQMSYSKMVEDGDQEDFKMLKYRTEQNLEARQADD